MARDPRKNSAFESGMRGREQPKVESGNTGGDRGGRGPDGKSGSEHHQRAGMTVGDANGIDHTDPVYSSGMRGVERPKQKPASGAANLEPDGAMQKGNHQKPGTHIGEPRGEQSWSADDKGPKKGVTDEEARARGEESYELGRNQNAANSSERAAEGEEPEGEGILGEEDDTHINIRIPKASLKKKSPGVQMS